MGKKSRLKKERRELRKKENLLLAPARNGLPPGDYLYVATPKNIVFLDSHEGRIYRFFSEAWQADAFVQGDIFLSTLDRCRAYEDAEQGDREEGHETYYIDHLVGGSDDPQFVEQARRLGFHDGGGNTNVTFENMSNTTRIRDAYVLCTTTEFSPEKLNDTFGKYCVEITNPRHFFVLLSEKIKAISPICVAYSGKVTYADRKYTGMNSPSGVIGFVKPISPYANQKEFRFLWHMQQKVKLEPFVLKCPEVRAMCRRIA